MCGACEEGGGKWKCEALQYKIEGTLEILSEKMTSKKGEPEGKRAQRKAPTKPKTPLGDP